MIFIPPASAAVRQRRGARVASLASELGDSQRPQWSRTFAFEGKRRMMQAEQALQELIGRSTRSSSFPTSV